MVAASSVFFLAYGNLVGEHNGSAAVACLLFNLFLAISAFALSFTRRFDALWRPATFCMAVAFLLNAASLGIANDESSMLFATLLLAMAYSGALLPWPPLWQAGFNLIALGSWAGVVFSGAIQDANSPYRWIGLAIAAVLGVVTSLIRTHESDELLCAREEAMAASRAKSDFLSRMSHEIRTPLNAVIGMIDLLRDTGVTEDQRRYLTTMADNGIALVEIVNDILDLARIESGRMMLEEAPFDLEALIDGVIGTFAVRAHEKGLELAAQVAPDVPVALVGDPLRVRQILLNLVGNANKFTTRGQIVLAVERDRARAGHGEVVLHFSVADTGIGIAPAQIERIFDAFSQADSSTTRKYGGTGLGLAIVKQLTDLFHGRVWVESKAGRGSTFHFSARFKIDPHHGRRAIGTGVPSDLKGLRALVVDDTAVNRAVVSEALCSRGARVSEADCGEAALNEIARAREAGDPYRLMVVDYRMPGIDGLEVARRVGESTDGETVVLMLTSDDLAIQLRLVQSATIANYLVKPIRRRELLEAIERALGEETRRAAPSIRAASPDDRVRPLRILLADDSADNRYIVAAYLKDTPHLIDQAGDGAEAVTRFAENAYDLVLMDVQMPVMDGHQAAAAMRACERRQGRAHTPIIALTADVMSESIERSFTAGCDEHVTKPVRKAALLAAIDRLTGASPEAHPQA